MYPGRRGPSSSSSAARAFHILACFDLLRPSEAGCALTLVGGEAVGGEKALTRHHSQDARAGRLSSCWWARNPPFPTIRVVSRLLKSLCGAQGLLSPQYGKVTAFVFALTEDISHPPTSSIQTPGWSAIHVSQRSVWGPTQKLYL